MVSAEELSELQAQVEILEAKVEENEKDIATLKKTLSRFESMFPRLMRIHLAKDKK